MRLKSPTAAFTLVELAIVLVIIGLLVGGVLAGKDILHGSQLQKTIKQVTDINQATTTFRDQYGGFPGDITNATSFWPSATNGNGNKIIETAASGTCATVGTIAASDLDCPDFAGERAQFFMQLGLAGLTNPYTSAATLDAGYPRLPVNKSAGMIVGSAWLNAAASNMKMENYANSSVYLYLGVCAPSSLNVGAPFNNCGTLIPVDAQNMDIKIDDGLPLSGVVFGQSYNTICATGTAANTTSVTATNSYNISSSVPGCNLLVNIGD